jgi:hypothetical protein
MQHARHLMLSRPFLTRIPDQALIASQVGSGSYHVRATRDAAGSYALVYLPAGQAVELDVTALSGEHVRCFWYDPRSGAASQIGTLQRQDRMRFTPPGGGPDWVLVIDDAARGFPAPGTVVDGSR